MQHRAYIRNGVPGWSPERQNEVLHNAGFKGTIYQDKLSQKQIRSRMVAMLKDRAELLRPTARASDEVIWVASFLCLAFNAVDLTSALAAASARNATVKAVTEGMEIAPRAGVSEIALAAQAFDRARKGEQTREGRSRGNAVAAELARQRSAPKITEAKKLWGLPTKTISTRDIGLQVGLSVKTLYDYLGPRSEAQKRKKKEPSNA